MNLVAGIIVAAFGIIIAVLGATGVVHGVTQPGVVLVLFGGLIVALSFIKKPDDEGTARMATPSTLLNIFISPGEVFQNLRRHPRWLVAAIVMTICSATYTNLFLQRLGPDNVANFAIDKTLQMGMIRDNEPAKKQIEEGRPRALADNKDPVVRGAQALSGFGASVFGYAFLALIFFLFSMAMGGKINFWQAFSVAVYAAFPVNILKSVLNTIVLYLKDPIDIHPILGQQSLIQDSLNFLVLSSEHPVIFTLLGSFSLLTFYWIAMNAIGLKNGGEKVSSGSAWTISIALFGFLLVLGCAMAFLFPSFIS